MNAFRNEVFSQTDKEKKEFFSDGQAKRCPITGETITVETSHVDHSKPFTFERLFDYFVQKQGINVSELDYNNLNNMRTLVDRELAEKWAAFHKKNARLQIVSKKANLSILRKT